MAFQFDEKLTPREFELMQHEKEQAEAVRAHTVTMRSLDLDNERLRLKWQQIFTIPLALITLPVKLVAGLALVVAYARKHEPSERFWQFLR